MTKPNNNHIVLVVVVMVAMLACRTYAQPMVKSHFGKIVGIEQTTADGHKVDAYLGIRYARAERFMRPTMVKPWVDTYHATHIRHACPQKAMTFAPEHVFGPDDSETSFTSEDCLFLNIWKPLDFDLFKLPVVVWLHPGAFKKGTIFTDTYDGRELAALGNVIVVSVAYRLGVLGFMPTDTVNGNQGLYDQMLALEWIHKAIGEFGGNKNRVTLMGESAGAITSGLLAIWHPQPQTYFQQAIIQSGSPLRLVVPLNESVKSSMSYAAKVNCTANEELKSVAECLRNRSVDELIDASSASFVVDLYMPSYDNVEFVEPKKALKAMDVDLMYGIVKDEGVFFFPELFDPSLPITLKMVAAIIVAILNGSNIVGREQDEIVAFYTRNLTENSNEIEIRKALEDVVGDYGLACPTAFFGDSPRKRNHRASNRFAYQLSQANTNYGCAQHLDQVCHQSDVLYVFGAPLRKNSRHNFIKEDEQFSRTIIKAWSNFIKYGHPGRVEGEDWKESTANAPKYMNLKSGQSRMHHSPLLAERCQLWRKHIL